MADLLKAFEDACASHAHLPPARAANNIKAAIDALVPNEPGTIVEVRQVETGFRLDLRLYRPNRPPIPQPAVEPPTPGIVVPFQLPETSKAFLRRVSLLRDQWVLDPEGRIRHAIHMTTDGEPACPMVACIVAAGSWAASTDGALFAHYYGMQRRTEVLAFDLASDSRRHDGVGEVTAEMHAAYRKALLEACNLKETDADE